MALPPTATTSFVARVEAELRARRERRFERCPVCLHAVAASDDFVSVERRLYHARCAGQAQPGLRPPLEAA